MVESSAFQLSRIYARGWSAGRKCDVEDVSAIDALGESLNPCVLPGERKRWHLGFTEAISRRQTGARKSHYQL